MTRALNLDDIQGNITRAYGRFSFPFARYFFFNIADAAAGRKFVNDVRSKVTTAARWPDQTEKPVCTVNIAFTYPGMEKLQVAAETLRGMPDAFSQGMKARAFVLGDRDLTKPESDDQNWDAHWDPIWQQNRAGVKGLQDVHIWISLNAQFKEGSIEPAAELEANTKWLRDLCKKSKKGVRLLAGTGRDGKADFQEASAVFDKIGDVIFPTQKEHFGFTDGISDPVFEGQYRDEELKDMVVGRGKRENGKWKPLATGEFLLGHPDESQELPPTARPPEFMRNGSYMAYRKLHENVGSFKQVLKAEAKTYAAAMDVPLAEADETLRAKMCGRWSDGVPLAKVPTYAEWQKFRDDHEFDDPNPFVALKNQREYTRSSDASNFRYADDMQGKNCPGGAHIRRVNTRDYLDPKNRPDGENKDATSALNRRRRILRRGLPYGPANFEKKTDKTEQGVAMMLLGANLFRQFEFVQQQWIQYGLDFHQGNNTCPLLGNHDHHKRHTIPGDAATGKQPYVMSKLKTFVECRGGDYFFIPSMTALRMISMGIIDPT